MTTDHLWVLVSAFFIFLMQAGFKALESGLISSKHRDGTSVKNVIDYIIGVIAFFGIGYGFMFGDSWHGLLGVSYFFGENIDNNNGEVAGSIIFFLFQLGFVTTAITIVSGAMAGRIGFMPYIISSFISAIFIYPLVGHWIWGNAILADNNAWLAKLGFVDFAGSTVVHSVGAWIALAGVMLAGSRINRYSPQGTLNGIKSNYSYALLGVILLWVGWWAFNGGSLLKFDNKVGEIILNTNLAAACGGLIAFMHSYFFQQKNDLIDKLIGGILTGLVAITACCHVVSPMNSMVIGASAGLIHNFVFDWLIKAKRFDDAVGAVPVHGFGGVWGTLCVAIFGKAELLPLPRYEQFGVQLLGVVVCFIFVFSVAYLTFKILKATIGLRVSPKQEVEGIFWGMKSWIVQEEVKEKESAKSEEIDYISVRKSTDGFNLYSIKDFLAIPLLNRNQFIKQNKVQFWDKSGRVLNQEVALQFLGEQIEIDRDSIRQEKQQMTDSMLYARRIQQAVEPSPELVHRLLPESFIVSKPRDIVSGDFYWILPKENKIFLAVVDCTGHGAPAAFLGMMGTAFLNEIVKADFSPAEILEKLRRRVKKSLNPVGKETETKEGMNVALISYEPEKRQLQFAGAYHPLYIIRKSTETSPAQFYEIEADRMPIGIYPKEIDFTNHLFQLQHNDMVYAFSDGFSDQNGGIEGKKFMKKKFKELLCKISHLPAEQQKEQLEETFQQWKAEYKQVDDVLIVGFRAIF